MSGPHGEAARDQGRPREHNTFGQRFGSDIGGMFTKHAVHESGGYFAHGVHLATSMINPLWWINRMNAARAQAMRVREYEAKHSNMPHFTPSPQIFERAFGDLKKSPFYKKDPQHQAHTIPASLYIAASNEVKAIERLRLNLSEDLKAKKEIKPGRILEAELKSLWDVAKGRAEIASYYESLQRMMMTEGNPEKIATFHRDVMIKAHQLEMLAKANEGLYPKLYMEYEATLKEK